MKISQAYFTLFENTRPKQQFQAQRLSSQMQKRCAHNNFTINATDQIQIHISSDFDSGNLQSVNLMSVSESKQSEVQIVKLQLIPAVDPFNAQYSTKQPLKTFFHFSVKSNKNIILYANVRRMNILSIIEGSFEQYYRICVGRKKNLYQIPQYEKQKPQFMELTKNWDDYTLQFKYQIGQNERVYFAYHFPYSYQKLSHFLQDLDQNLKHSKQHIQNPGIIGGVHGVGIGEINDIYYRNQLLIQSNEGRQINLLTITQISDTQKKNGFINLPRQSRISKSLFPYFEIQDRPFKFNKPYIMVTSRVHPGETSASYALEGLIKRLLSSTPEAEFLRKTFVFLIVPMINPDGVFNGTYRMDILGHNLNRFYNNCVSYKQPSIFAINSLLHYHSQDLVAFFDIHSHPQAKGSFVYGNAYNSIYDQIQSQLFTKLLSYNSECFSYENCTFSQKNMNSKDINDILSKDGSARVCAYKKMLSANICNGVHCYAIQLGYHGCPVRKEINKNEPIFQFKSEYRRQVVQFDVADYMQIGGALINTLAQTYIQNYRNSLMINFDPNIQISQLVNPQNLKNYLLTLRQQVSKQIYDKDQRFRIMDSGLLKKLKNINILSFSNFYSKIFKKYPTIQQNIKSYQEKKNGKKQVTRSNRLITKQPENSMRVVHSLELNKNITRLKSSMDTKKQTITNQQKIVTKEARNFIFRSVKQKINITPVQFHLPNPKNLADNKNQKKKQLNFDQILDMHVQSLPRINKKKLNLLTERLRNKKRRAQSSISNLNQNLEQKIIQGLPVSRGSLEKKYKFLENAIYENNIEGIIDYETYMNIGGDEQQQEDYEKIFQQATEEYKNNNNNPEFGSALNMVRNQAMFRKQTISKRDHRKIQINHQTQRLRRKLEIYQQRNRSQSKQKQHIQALNNHIGLRVKILPKLQGKTERIKHNKFDLQLKMKQKYDKKYKLDDL